MFRGVLATEINLITQDNWDATITLKTRPLRSFTFIKELCSINKARTHKRNSLHDLVYLLGYRRWVPAYDRF